MTVLAIKDKEENMKFKSLMIIKSAVCLGFAPPMLFFPAWLLGLFGLAFGTGAALTAREYGAALAGNMLPRLALNSDSNRLSLYLDANTPSCASV